MNAQIVEPKMKTLATPRPVFILPILLFVFVFTLASFPGSLLHEGGHALVNLASGVRITNFIIHPFSFAGYVRPFVDSNNVWQHAAGPLGGLIPGLAIFILCWKRRSPALLPLLLMFPMDAIVQGLAAAMLLYDYNNLVNIIGIPALLLQIPGILLIVVGIFLTISLFPLFGLSPQDKKSLFVFPAGFFLCTVFGLVIAYIFVPVSSFYKTEGVVAETLNSAHQAMIAMTVLGAVLSALYVSLYRWLSPKLPAWLRTEPVTLAWKDLRLLAALFAVCVAVGLIIIR